VTPGRRRLRSFLRDPQGLLGLAVLVTLVAGAVLAPRLAPSDPLVINIGQRLRPPAWEEDGDRKNPLGTDLLGRDILSRIIYGARVSLLIGLSAATVSGIVGVAIGLAAGYTRGRFDGVAMRVADTQYALPWLVIVIAVIAVIGPSVASLIVTLALWTWVPFARVVRGVTLSSREEVYVEAAQATGASGTRIIVRHLLPGVVYSAIVIWSFSIAQVMLSETALSFLGLGVQPPTPSWGSMVGEGRAYVSSAWWIITFPGLAIMLAVLGINMLGDALHDALDPRVVSRGR
jgi:peptide/nickel transport system permease protein